MRPTSALLRLDLLRRRRAWGFRLPAIFGSRGERVVQIVLGGWITGTAVAALLGAVVLVALAEDPAPDRLMNPLVAALLALVALSTASGVSAQRFVDSFEQADTVTLSRMGLDARDLAVARVWAPLQVRLAVIAVTAALVGLFAWVPVRPPIDLTPIVCVAAYWLLGANLALAGSAALFGAIVRLPARWVGPAVFGSGLFTDLLRAIVPIALLTWVAGSARQGRQTSDADFAQRLQTWSATSLADWLEHPWLVSLAALAAAALAYGGARWLLPRNVPFVLRQLSAGHRWRINAPFRGSTARVVADKDLRLLARRGVPAWQVLDEAFDVVPLALMAGLAAEVGTRTVDGVGTIAALTLLCTVTAAIGMAGEALTPLVTTDADGATLRMFRWNGSSFSAYLGGKAITATLAFMVVGLTAAAAIHLVSPWSLGELPVLALTIAAASLAEALCIVVGSAYRPALFRPALGVAELEPSVKLAAGIAAGLVIAAITPLAFLTTRLPSMGVFAATAVSLLVLIGAVVVAGRSAGPLYANLTKGGAVHYGHGLGRTGSA